MAKKEKKKKKKCFVISPIGDEGSKIRKYSDKVLKYIIEPVTKDCGYQVNRADKISKPGIIATQVIQHIIDDDLVVADLTEKNPNVFYELAIRHAIKKPVILIIQYNESIPFDVATTRIIKFDYKDIESVEKCKDEIKEQILSIEKDPSLY